ncbi:hypothetical protein [Anaerolentibacter hominis]|uniref:hypothetical protein n=1 Tax=Anaerolentibacter hominis TaxID=3079009 RepID=UPI0031B80DA1
MRRKKTIKWRIAGSCLLLFLFLPVGERAVQVAAQNSRMGTGENIYMSSSSVSNEDKTLDTATGSGDMQTEFTGQIAPTIISAEVPVKVSFQVDPGTVYQPVTADGQTLELSRIINPSNAQVINTSTVPIRVNVVSVGREQFIPGADANPYNKDWELPNDFSLVGNLDGMKAGNALLVVGEENETFASEAAFLARALVPTEAGENPTPIPVMEVDGITSGNLAPSKNLWVYGRVVSNHYYGHYSFNVSITIRIESI